MQADVVRCRRNVMWLAQDPWPIFCVLDRPVPVSGPCDLEPGFYFVTPGGPTLDPWLDEDSLGNVVPPPPLRGCPLN